MASKENKTGVKNQAEAKIEDPRKVFSDALVKLGAENQDVLYISCDSSLGASGSEFNKRYPERHFEFGLLETHFRVGDRKATGDEAHPNPNPQRKADELWRWWA